MCHRRYCEPDDQVGQPHHDQLYRTSSRARSNLGDAIVFFKTGQDGGAAIDHACDLLVCLAARIEVEVGHEVEIEITITIVIAKCWCVSRTNEVHAELLGFFSKRAITVVDEQVVGRIEIANVDIQIAIVVNVGHRRAGTPSVTRIQLGAISDIFELQRTGLAVEPILPRSAGKKNVRPTIVIHVPNRHATASDNGRKQVLLSVRVIDRVNEIDSRCVWRKRLEHSRCGIACCGLKRFRR